MAIKLAGQWDRALFTLYFLCLLQVSSIALINNGWPCSCPPIFIALTYQANAWADNCTQILLPKALKHKIFVNICLASIFELQKSEMHQHGSRNNSVASTDRTGRAGKSLLQSGRRSTSLAFNLAHFLSTFCKLNYAREQITYTEQAYRGLIYCLKWSMAS